MNTRDTYDEALAYRWQDAFVHHTLGFSLIDAAELDEAAKAWLLVLELEPDYDFTHFGHVLAGRPN